jgi:hypothetical protein
MPEVSERRGKENFGHEIPRAEAERGMTNFSDVLAKAPRGMGDELAALDPRHFRGDYSRWFRLMVKCRFNGVAREEWIAWCQRDEKYAGEKHAKWIGKSWDSLRGSE